MTSIRRLTKNRPSQSGSLGVHSLHDFHFSVPDLIAAQNFYATFGLDARAEGNELALYTFGNDHRWGSIGEGSCKKYQYVSFGIFEEDEERFKQHFDRLGIARMPPPPGVESNGIWIMDPDGNPIEIRIADKVSPDEKSSVSNPPGLANSRNAPSRSRAPTVRPRRLAHILLFTRDISKTIAFYHNALGLRLSDRSGELIAFMHGIHGSDHHMIAFAKSDAPGLHHLSWDVGSINDIGFGAKQMAERGYMDGWGLGRHVLGSNYFHYVRDPWGSYSEYSCDIDYIPAGSDWTGADHPPEDSFYVWGPNPPDDFAFNHEIAGRSP